MNNISETIFEYEQLLASDKPIEAELVPHLYKILPMQAISYSKDSHEFNYILKDYLINYKGYISEKNKITPKGWEFIESH